MQPALPSDKPVRSGKRFWVRRRSGQTTPPPEVVRALRAWQQWQNQAQANDEEQLEGYAEYREFVGVEGIDFVRATAERRRTAAGELAVSVAEAGRPLREEVEQSTETELEHKVGHIRDEVRTLELQLLQTQERLPSVVDLEDDLEAETQRLRELEELDATLAKAVDHLLEAEEYVYRELAPKLQASVHRHLSQVTGGRYEACKIDPDSPGAGSAVARSGRSASKQPLARHSGTDLPPASLCPGRTHDTARPEVPPDFG